MRSLQLCFLVLCAAAACTDARKPPARPLLVPATAAWAGGADGGAWIDCWRASDLQKQKDGQPHPELDDRFACSVYRDTGAVDAKGTFRLLDVDDALALHPARDPRRVLQFTAWDGCVIHAAPQRVLANEARLRCSGDTCVDSGCP